MSVESTNITPIQQEKKVPTSTIPPTWLQPLLITKDTRDILELLKKELKEIYWEDLSSDDDIILYLYSYYCRK